MRKFSAVFWDSIANLGGFAGLLALIWPLVAIYNRPAVAANPDLQELVSFSIWIVAIALSAVIILTIVQWRKIQIAQDARFVLTRIADLEGQHEKIASIVHNLTHDARDQMLHLLLAKEVFPKLPPEEQRETMERIERNWGMFNLSYMDNLKTLFDSVTGRSNSVCIKLLREEAVSSQPMPRHAEVALPPATETLHSVRTLYRDTSSNRLRRENDIRLAKYEASSNSAFARILSADTKDFYFLSNDLKNEPTYVNTNPRWREFYNSALVSPVRIENFTATAHKDKYLTYGFFCVDSKSAQYRKDVELEFLQAFSDLYFPILHAFDGWRKAVQAVQHDGDAPDALPKTNSAPLST